MKLDKSPLLENGFFIVNFSRSSYLALIEKSHLHSPKQIEFAEEKNPFRKTVCGKND